MVQQESDSDWINAAAAAAVIFVCALACIILPSFRELRELVVIVLDTSCVLKPCEGPHCTLVEVKKSSIFFCEVGFVSYIVR